MRTRRALRAVLVAALAAGQVSCGADGGTGVTLSFAFDVLPADTLYVWARVEERPDPAEPGVILASAGPAVFEPGGGLELAMDAVPVGADRVVIVEGREGESAALRILYFGVSAPFDLVAGEQRVVEVPVSLQSSVGNWDGATAALRFDGEVREAVTDLAGATVRTVSPAPAAITLANDAQFSAGLVRYERDDPAVSCAAAPAAGPGWEACDVASWDLAAGVAAGDGAYSVYVRLSDELGYDSPTYEASVRLDTTPPAVQSATIAPVPASSGDDVTLTLVMSEELAVGAALALTPATGGPTFLGPTRQGDSTTYSWSAVVSNTTLVGAYTFEIALQDLVGLAFAGPVLDAAGQAVTLEVVAESADDFDGDGILNDADNCSLKANADQLDTDGDGEGDACDDDDDGDDKADAIDVCPLVADPGQEDLDGDGAGDACDDDDDGDNVGDASDLCPLVADPGQEDQDGDGDGDACDDDDDGDGVADDVDVCPQLADADQANTDGDLLGDACDSDDDNDGDPDLLDSCPLVANPDQLDTDSDGDGDACDDDDDGDGVLDSDDSCPLLVGPQDDLDGDGEGDVCDEDDDGDETADEHDNCPDASNPAQHDLDGDGQGDACDDDDDGDGSADLADNCPLIDNPGQEDLDGDGAGDVCDGDDDGDGWGDAEDKCPELADDQTDTDNDGAGDACDLNDDDDAFLDDEDCGPLDDTVYPGAVDTTCDGIDQDCNGVDALPEACEDGTPCVAWVCDFGSCSSSPTSGSTCSDGDLCSRNDSCVDGSCVGEVFSCDDGLACTDDVCDGAGCQHPITPTWCVIDAACVLEGAEHAGVPCEVCDPTGSQTQWSHAPDGASCSDGEPCTSGDECTDGSCGGASVTCDDGVVCTFDFCDLGVGCTHTPNHGACSDGVACTVGACSPVTGCEFSPNHLLCMDGDFCNGSEVCDLQNGCQPPATGPCDDGVPCTDDACDETFDTCTNTPNDANCAPGSCDVCDPTGGCGAPACTVATCSGKLNVCGDCADAGGDCLTDAREEGCLGPCDNSEDSYGFDIPGVPASCSMDCFFDGDSGDGNDGCAWDRRCDANADGTMCTFDDTVTVGGSALTCAEAESDQPQGCLNTCLPMTPNGCDCFGCCAAPGGGQHYFMGSPGTCTPEDQSGCLPCTPVSGCYNSCEECELCVGKPVLPGTCSGPQLCPGGEQACGLPGQGTCPADTYCITGCCVANTFK